MASSLNLNWEVLHAGEHFSLRRGGRYLLAELTGDHLVLSTSFRNGGQTRTLRFLVNHQSCEATLHIGRGDMIHAIGQDAYHAMVCAEMDLNQDEVALMGTAANMNYAATCTLRDQELEVTAVVTAGVHGNAACAGDPAPWREGPAGWNKADGTINTMLLINLPLSDAALARSAMTMTEAKSAALQQLAVPSLYSENLATGTGTDQFSIAAPLQGPYVLTSASPHVKLGELIGRTVRDATLEALRWQNGLEPSYTRSIFSALRRYGLREPSFFEDIRPLLSEQDFELLQRNGKAVFFEPLAAAGAYAFAAVLDRVRFKTLPQGVAAEVLRQQAALIAANLSAKPYLWQRFWTNLTEPDPIRLFRQAIALGWSAKWAS